MAEGFKWARQNVGSDHPEDNGDYFAWGETSPYYSNLIPLTWKEGKAYGYHWNSYQFGNAVTSTPTKYNTTDFKKILEACDDAATANLGDNWRMPTNAEWTALRNTDNFTWTWDDTRKGYTVTSKVSGYIGNSIFLPAAGCRYATSLPSTGFNGYYWSSSISLGYNPGANTLNFTSTTRTSGRQVRCWGVPVRAVSE